ncbi:hypothetical protein C9374_004201 [Naegleria lovaniensis]|uniref:Uncharacterized protein n=1 Tax=Naegleria lovaniensis TaxID=51637 RepID=A0AA88GNA1_NAELO|nr:uncharacterized protein C9374_004201 [Naegleria lovaniensis]KAG2383530.1 hypothetical protein C9374_004201 [Naegleria lovaniensis]
MNRLQARVCPLIKTTTTSPFLLQYMSIHIFRMQHEYSFSSIKPSFIPNISYSQHSIFNQRKKQSLNVVFVGNSGSGITTLLGYLTFICGGMDWKSIEPMWFGMGIARDTDQSPYRYLIDSPQDCHTKELHTIRLETKHFILNCISVPTQRKYEKLLLRGMFRADVAVIVVNINDAQLVRREWKFTDQIMALKSCGVVQSIVCVNMLDKNPSEDLFTHTASEILQIMKKQNMNIADTKVIACSALNGFGIVENINTEWNWYKGETLIEALDALKPHERPVWHPLRMVVEKVRHVKQGQRHEQLILTGRVICGVLRVGMKLCFSDKSLYFLNAPPPRIVSIQCFGQECEEAFPGDFVGILLETHDSNSNNTLLLSHIRRGTVVSDRSAEHQALQVKSFQAQVIVVHCPNRIRAGFTPLLHNQESRIPCKIDRIIAKLNRYTNALIESDPKYIQQYECFSAEFIPQQPIHLQTFTECAPFGRLVFCDQNCMWMAGVVRSVEYFE